MCHAYGTPSGYNGYSHFTEVSLLAVYMEFFNIDSIIVVGFIGKLGTEAFEWWSPLLCRPFGNVVKWRFEDLEGFPKCDYFSITEVRIVPASKERHAYKECDVTFHTIRCT